MNFISSLAKPMRGWEQKHMKLLPLLRKFDAKTGLPRPDLLPPPKKE